MKLTVFERVILNNILSEHRDDFLTLKLIRKVREELSLNEAENKLYRPQIREGKVIWRTADEKGNPIPQEKDIEIGETVTNIIKTDLKKLNDSKMLQDEHFSLYEKFIN